MVACICVCLCKWMSVCARVSVCVWDTYIRLFVKVVKLQVCGDIDKLISLTEKGWWITVLMFSPAFLVSPPRTWWPFVSVSALLQRGCKLHEWSLFEFMCWMARTRLKPFCDIPDLDAAVFIAIHWQGPSNVTPEFLLSHTHLHTPSCVTHCSKG